MRIFSAIEQLSEHQLPYLFSSHAYDCILFFYKNKVIFPFCKLLQWHALHCCFFCRKCALIDVNVCIKSRHIRSIRLHYKTGFSAKYTFTEITLQALVRIFAYHLRRQKCHSPRAALSCSLHNRNRGIHRSRKNSLSDPFCLKQPSMSINRVCFYLLFFKQNVAANL